MKKILAATLAIAAGSASADVTVGGFTFADNAFVDTLFGSSGGWSTASGNLASDITDIDAGTYAFSFETSAFLEVRFIDNIAMNLAGADLVIFEVGTPDIFDVEINGVRNQYLSVDTGESAGGFALNGLAIDLSDFGVANGDFITDVRLWGGNMEPNNGTVASYSLVGALNPVPAPASMALLGLGALVARRRR
jgi:hypothetical protein